MELISEHCKQTADLCKEKSSTYMSLSLHAIVLIQDAANKVGALPLKVHFLSTESNRYWNVKKKMSNFQEKCSNFCQKLTVQNGCKLFCVHSWVELSYENKSENAIKLVKNAKNHKSYIHRHISKSGGLPLAWSNHGFRLGSVKSKQLMKNDNKSTSEKFSNLPFRTLASICSKSLVCKRPIVLTQLLRYWLEQPVQGQ